MKGILMAIITLHITQVKPNRIYLVLLIKVTDMLVLNNSYEMHDICLSNVYFIERWMKLSQSRFAPI